MLVAIKQIKSNIPNGIIFSNINGNLTANSTLTYDGSIFNFDSDEFNVKSNNFSFTKNNIGIGYDSNLFIGKSGQKGIIYSTNFGTLEYVDNYSANYTNRSLTDKEYVNNLIGNSIDNIIFGNGLTKSLESPNISIELGGVLTKNTIISGCSPASYSLNFTDLSSFSLNSIGSISFTGSSFLVSTLSGTGDRMVVANASGVLSTQAIPTGTITGAANGLTNNSGTIELGGTLTQNTIITGGSPNHSLTFSDLSSFNLSSSGDIEFTGHSFSFNGLPGSPGPFFKISTLSGGGNKMVITDNDGILSAQDIPSSATLTSTYVGYGDTYGLLNGSADFIYNSDGKLIINKNNITFSSPFNSSIEGILVGVNNEYETISIMNTNTNAFTGFIAGQSSSNFISLGNFGSAYTGQYAGTSIDIKSTAHIRAASYNIPMVLGGSPIINLIGTTSTNYGTRLDATGFRIGILSTMHTSNSYAFETSGNVRFENLAGNGPGFVAVDNSGVLSFTNNNAIEMSDAYNLFNYYNFI